MPSAKLKMTALAPTPSPMETIAVKANPGVCRSVRKL